MSVTDASRTTLATGTRTNSSWTKPASLADTDYLVLIMNAGASVASGNAVVTGPTGFTNLAGSGTTPIQILTDPSDVTFEVRDYVYYKLVTNAAGEPASYATSHASASTDGILIRVSGADATSPFVPSYTINNGGGSTTTFPSLVGVVANSLVVAHSCCWDGQNGAAPAGTTPTYTEEWDSGATGSGYTADGTWAAGGTTGTKTNSNSNIPPNHWISMQLAMQPQLPFPGEDDGMTFWNRTVW